MRHLELRQETFRDVKRDRSVGSDQQQHIRLTFLVVERGQVGLEGVDVLRGSGRRFVNPIVGFPIVNQFARRDEQRIKPGGEPVEVGG